MDTKANTTHHDDESNTTDAGPFDTGDPHRCATCTRKLSPGQRLSAEPALLTFIDTPENWDVDGRDAVDGELIVGLCDDCWLTYDVEGVLSSELLLSDGVDPETGEQSHHLNHQVRDLLGDVSVQWLRQTGDGGDESPGGDS